MVISRAGFENTGRLRISYSVRQVITDIIVLFLAKVLHAESN